MSTKIYNGYRLTPIDGRRADPFTLITDLRARLKPVHDYAAAKLMAMHAEDLASGNTGPFKMSLIGEAWRDLRKTIDRMDREPYRNFGADLAFEVTFLADPGDPVGMYALLFTEVGDFERVWEATPGVEPWPYWDNCNRPDELTDEQWDHRRDVWDRILGWDTPVSRGLSWTPHGSAADRLPLPHDIKDLVARAAAELGLDVTVDDLYAKGGAA